MMPEEADPVGRILRRNRSKDFVRRVLDPQNYPTLPLPQFGPQTFGTHLMSSAQISPDKSIVYPNIVYDRRTKALRLLPPKEAVDHALSTGEYISFSTPEEADAFSKIYKRGR